VRLSESATRRRRTTNDDDDDDERRVDPPCCRVESLSLYLSVCCALLGWLLNRFSVQLLCVRAVRLGHRPSRASTPFFVLWWLVAGWLVVVWWRCVRVTCDGDLQRREPCSKKNPENPHAHNRVCAPNLPRHPPSSTSEEPTELEVVRTLQSLLTPRFICTSPRVHPPLPHTLSAKQASKQGGGGGGGGGGGRCQGVELK
jgi:hypothetical protein